MDIRGGAASEGDGYDERAEAENLPCDDGVSGPMGVWRAGVCAILRGGVPRARASARGDHLREPIDDDRAVAMADERVREGARR